MAASADIVTAAEVKTYLGITGTTHDTLIDELIDLVSEFLEDYLNTCFSTPILTELYDGGQEFIITKRSPINSITSITDVLDGSTVIAATDYDSYDESGLIYRSNTLSIVDGDESVLKWAPGKRRFQVVYVPDYIAPPEPIKWAAYEIIARNLKLLPNSNNKGRWTQPDHKEFDTKLQPEIALTPKEVYILGRYRNREV